LKYRDRARPGLNILIPATLLVLFLGSGTLLFSQGGGKHSAQVVPGSITLLTATAEFPGCFVEKNGNGTWFRCEDTHLKGPIPGASVWPRVHKELEFNVTEPGHIYVVFKGHVAENVWCYGGPSCELHVKRKGTKEAWDRVWGFPVHGASWHGSKLMGGPTGIPPVTWTTRADGSRDFNNAPHIEPGRYRVFIVSAKRDNRNIAEHVYVPSDCSVKVYLVPDRPHHSGGSKKDSGGVHKPAPGVLYYKMSGCE